MYVYWTITVVKKWDKRYALKLEILQDVGLSTFRVESKEKELGSVKTTPCGPSLNHVGL
jgi:hypothetical protein